MAKQPQPLTDRKPSLAYAPPDPPAEQATPEDAALARINQVLVPAIRNLSESQRAYVAVRLTEACGFSGDQLRARALVG